MGDSESDLMLLDDLPATLNTAAVPKPAPWSIPRRPLYRLNLCCGVAAQHI